MNKSIYIVLLLINPITDNELIKYIQYKTEEIS